MTNPNPTPDTDEQDGGDVDPGATDLLTGTAHDGPLDGGTMTSRRPAGVLLIDRPAGQCWLYDWHPADSGFYCRSTDPMPLVTDPDAADNSERAAEEGDWDVQAAPWVGGDPDLIDPDGDPDTEPDAQQDDEDDDQGDATEVTGPVDGQEG